MQKDKDNNQIPPVGLELKKTKPYNPNSRPNFDLAFEHGQANKVYKKEPIQGVKTCLCCKLPVQGKLIPLKAPPAELYHLGAGVVLYFQLIKYCVALLTIILAISGIFNTIANILGDDCEIDCVDSYTAIFTIDNRRNGHVISIRIQMILNLFTVIACILFFQYMDYKFRETELEIQKTKITPSLYTLKVYGLDPSMTDLEIKTWIEGVKTKKPVKCYKIHRAYNLDEYLKLVRKKILKRAEKDSELDEITKLVIQEEKKKLDDQIKKFIDNLQPAPFVYITLETIDQANQVLKKFHKITRKGFKDSLLNMLYISKRNINGQRVRIKRAPEPADILWMNHTLHPLQKLIRITITTILAGIILVICVLLVAIIEMIQKDIIGLFSFVLSIMIWIIDQALGKVTKYLAEKEKHTSFTGFYVGTARKTCAFQFVTTAVSLLLAQIVLVKLFSGYEKKDREWEYYLYFLEALGTVFNLFIQNLVLIPFLIICDPWYIIKLYKQRKARRTNNIPNVKTQKEANEFFEAPHMDFPAKNASLVKTMLTTCLFAPGIPIILIPAIILLVLVYWIDKYFLLRRASFPIPLNANLNTRIVSILKRMTLMFAIGNILSILALQYNEGDQIIPKEILILAFLTLALSILHLILPVKLINERLFRIKNQQFSGMHTYEETGFTLDYDNTNPIPSKTVNLMKNYQAKDHQMNDEKDIIQDPKKISIEIRDNEDNTRIKPEEKVNQQASVDQVALFKSFALQLTDNDLKDKKHMNFITFNINGNTTPNTQADNKQNF